MSTAFNPYIIVYFSDHLIHSFILLHLSVSYYISVFAAVSIHLLVPVVSSIRQNIVYSKPE